MGQIHHGSATTTEAVRRVIQNRHASLRELAARHCINAKTVAKWRKCTTTCDAPDGAESTASLLRYADQLRRPRRCRPKN